MYKNNNNIFTWLILKTQTLNIIESYIVLFFFFQVLILCFIKLYFLLITYTFLCIIFVSELTHAQSLTCYVFRLGTYQSSHTCSTQVLSVKRFFFPPGARGHDIACGYYNIMYMTCILRSGVNWF